MEENLITIHLVLETLNEQKQYMLTGKVYVFRKENDETTCIEYTKSYKCFCSGWRETKDNPTSWTSVPKMYQQIDTYSATAWAGNIYFQAGTNNKQIYKLDVTTDNNELVL